MFQLLCRSTSCYLRAPEATRVTKHWRTVFLSMRWDAWWDMESIFNSPCPNVHFISQHNTFLQLQYLFPALLKTIWGGRSADLSLFWCCPPHRWSWTSWPSSTSSTSVFSTPTSSWRSRSAETSCGSPSASPSGTAPRSTTTFRSSKPSSHHRFLPSCPQRRPRSRRCLANSVWMLNVLWSLLSGYIGFFFVFNQ